MEIPADLHTEVLKFLPSKSLMRFRCVSKTWNLTIIDPKFSQLHRTISQTRPGATTTTTILLTDEEEDKRLFHFFKINLQREAIHELTIGPSELWLDQTIDTSEFTLKGCLFTQVVNGLICFYEKGHALICNITTREIVSLPTQPRLDSDAHYNLGYDPLKNEYKVLCIWKGIKCTVLTIGKEKEWREVISPFDFKLHYWMFTIKSLGRYDMSLHHVVYYDGTICWLNRIDGIDMQKFVAFDVREEKFRTISFPVKPESGVSNMILQLVKIGGCIALCGFFGGSNFFILEDYTNQVWVERNIPLPEFFGVIGGMENKLIFQDMTCKEFSFDPNNGDISHFKISGFDHVIKESKGSKRFTAKISICEIVENIYPLRQN